MLSETISRVINGLHQNVNEYDLGDPYFQQDAYRIYPFARENFYPINGNGSSRKIAFVDGGNQELIGAPNFSVQLNRIYFNVFNETQRINQNELPQTIDFFSVTLLNLNDDSIQYKTLLFATKNDFSDYLPFESHLSFDSTDRRLIRGTTRTDIKEVASVARRFAEWNYSRFIIDRILDKGDVLISDGTLQTSFPNEGHYLDVLHERARNKGVIFSGLAKTSNMITTTGLSLLGSLQKLVEDWGINFEEWYYSPLAEGLSKDHSVIMTIVKLHKKADHIFRYEISNRQMKDLDDLNLNEVITCLAKNSVDIGFPGYPYGLIDADNNARVRANEIETYRVMLLSEMSKLGLWKKFAHHMRSTDAHHILNLLVGGYGR